MLLSQISPLSCHPWIHCIAQQTFVLVYAGAGSDFFSQPLAVLSAIQRNQCVCWAVGMQSEPPQHRLHLTKAPHHAHEASQNLLNANMLPMSRPYCKHPPEEEGEEEIYKLRPANKADHLCQLWQSSSNLFRSHVCVCECVSVRGGSQYPLTESSCQPGDVPLERIGKVAALRMSHTMCVVCVRLQMTQESNNIDHKASSASDSRQQPLTGVTRHTNTRMLLLQ